MKSIMIGDLILIDSIFTWQLLPSLMIWLGLDIY